MVDNKEVIERLVEKTLDGDIEWIVGETTCFTKVDITNRKYISYKIGTNFHVGRYEKSLIVKLSSDRYSFTVLILYANKYKIIYELEEMVREFFTPLKKRK